MANDERRVAVLEEESTSPGFWDDQEQARQAMQELATLRQKVEAWRTLERRARDVKELLELAVTEEDDSIGPPAARELDEQEKELHAREFELRLSGE